MYAIVNLEGSRYFCSLDRDGVCFTDDIEYAVLFFDCKYAMLVVAALDCIIDDFFDSVTVLFVDV